MLTGSQGPLWDAYDVAMLDLDGVVYIGPDAVPGAPEHLDAARDAGMHLAYVTNNASRTPAAVARHLRDLGIAVADEDVVTSAQAAARVLSEQLPDGSAVFVIGGEGLEVALARAGPPAGAGPGGEARRRGLRLPRRPALVDGDRGRDPGPRRAALGGLQHRHDGADARGSRARQRRPGRGGRPLRGPAAGGGRQAGVTAVRGDAAACGRRAAPGGRRPARHRHRGRQQHRLRQPAGDDRGDRPRPARGRRSPPCARRTSQQTWAAWDAGTTSRPPTATR